MQEQKATKIGKLIRKIGIKNLIYLSLFGCIMVVALGVVLYSYRHIPVAEWREYSSGFPRAGAEGVVLQDVQATWNSAKGNARMELRTAYYPSATLTLSGTKGSGMLLVHFADSKNRQRGDTLSLAYKDGKFVPRKDVDIQAENETATVLIETGFGDEASYLLHCLNEEEPLWRVYVRQRPQGSGETYLLGYRTITALPISEKQ